MYELHTTQNGDTLLICCMEDSHLINTIRSLCLKVQAAVEMLTSTTPDDPLISIFQPQYSKAAMQEKAKDSLEFLHQRLQPYVMEATLRGLEVASMLQSAYGRTTRIAMPSKLALEAEVEVNEAFPL
ncbi:MAG: hypothetical protein O3C67_02970 [Cyanobacteria bacterium]|nr:hypothetical protein [Cyanobacteriota bacterium]